MLKVAAAQPCLERELLHERRRRDAKLGREQFGVGRGNAKGNERASVAEHGGADDLGDLFGVLVGKTEIGRELARLGKDRCEGVGRERLEFVHMDEVRHPRSGGMVLRAIAVSWMWETRRDPRTLVACSPIVPLARFAITICWWSIACASENFGDVCPRMSRRLGEVVNWPALLRIGAVTSKRYCGAYLPNSSSQNRRVTGSVFDLHDAAAEIGVGIEARQVNEGGARQVEERTHPVVKEVLGPRAPAVAPEVLERRHDAGCRQRPAAGRYGGDWIEADRLCGVADIEVAHIIRAAARDAVNDALGEVAVGSMIVTPSPASMSLIAMLKSVVVFPDPLFPTM